MTQPFSSGLARESSGRKRRVPRTAVEFGMQDDPGARTMNPARIIYEDTPAYIPIPDELRHRKVEVIFWPLDDELPPAPKPRRRPPAALAGKARDVGDVLSSAPDADWGVEE